MTNIEKELQELHSKLHTLRLYQSSMQDEIGRIELKLRQLQVAVGQPQAAPPPEKKPEIIEEPKVIIAPPPKQEDRAHRNIAQPLARQATALENFIGTNLISKIGILITIIGVFIGARYAIDRNLISPETRIILSYCFAAALAFIGFRLKKKYNAFSAVLMGGSIAIAYFSTYVGHTYYNLMPQLPAFAIMFVTTAVAIVMALWYDQKIIALIGQVAAYAIPILLSDGTGKPAVMFTYISIINAGLMVLSFRKNWKIIYRLAFSLTWSIYAGFVLFASHEKITWQWLLFFITLCYLTFYITYLSYKIFKKELYNIAEVSVLLLNAIIYYFLGYYLIDKNFVNTDALTVFTLANAALHIAAAFWIHRLKLADQSVRLFLFGQGLTFITIAIPVKLDGSWVTLLWTIESATLIYVAAKSRRKIYFQLCDAMMAITVISLIQDWFTTYSLKIGDIRLFLNETFITSMACAAMFLYASFTVRKIHLSADNNEMAVSFMKLFTPVIFLGVLYMGIYLEIYLYFHKLFLASEHHWQMDYLGISVLHLYTLVFLAVVRFAGNSYIKDEGFHNLIAIACAIAIASQLTMGLYSLAELRNTPYMWLRYLNIAGIALLWIAIWWSKKFFEVEHGKIALSIPLHITILTVICNEYVHWMKLYGISSEYKLGLSIIFGAYALIILTRGLLKNISYLRISAIVLFGITLVKLFTYDLRSLSTIGKTIVLIILGVILLIASFLYNRFVKKMITNENQN